MIKMVLSANDIIVKEQDIEGGIIQECNLAESKPYIVLYSGKKIMLDPSERNKK